MQDLKITVEGGRIRVENCPQAERVVRVSDRLAHRLADLSLHRDDLTYAKQCLNAISRLNTETPDAPVVQKALYRIAIVYLFKCFGNSVSRSSIDPRKIYGPEGPVALEVFEYFKVVRDKHLVHDENAYTQSHPGAIINKVGNAKTVEMVVCLNLAVQIVQQESFENLNRLVDTALKWVVKEYDDLAERLRSDLDKRPHAELLALPELVIPPLTEEQAKGARLR